MSCHLLGIEFWVNGSSIPLVDFDVGDSWAGLIPISNATDETRQVRALKYVHSRSLRQMVDSSHLVVLLVFPSWSRRKFGRLDLLVRFVSCVIRSDHSYTLT